MSLERCLLIGLALRGLAAVAVTLLGDTGETLRGPDDAAFLDAAQRLASLPITDAEWPRELAGDLHTALLAFELAVLGDPGDTSLRLTQGAIELLGVLLFAVAVHDIAGVRAAHVFGWIAVLEPTNLFFSTLLHKEALLILGAGLVLLGATALWRRRRDAAPLLSLVLGIALIASTRSYVAAAAIAAVLSAGAHAELRHRLGRRRAFAAMGAIVTLGLAALIVAGPRVAPSALARLQASHDFVPDDNSNLELGPVTVTTSEGLAETLVDRTAAFLVRPAPWQVENLSQQLGAIGTLLWWSLVAAVTAGLVASARRRTADLVPLAYLAACQTVLYALTLTNAAVGFRHRIHIVLLAAAAAAIVWRQVQGSRNEKQQPPVHDAEIRGSATRSIKTSAATLIVLACAALSLVACGDDGKNPAPAALAKARPEKAELSRPGAPGETIARLWQMVRGGAVPAAVLLYDPGVRAKIGVANLAGALASQQAALSDLRLALVGRTESPLGPVVDVQGRRPDGSVVNYSYVLQRRAGEWVVVFDTLMAGALQSYVVATAQAGRKRPPTDALQAANDIVSRFRTALFDDRGELVRSSRVEPGDEQASQRSDDDTGSPGEQP